MLLDIGYEDTVDELINLIRQLDFPLANCKYLVATHADADHVQGFQKAKEMLPGSQLVAHFEAKKILESGDRIASFAEIPMQGISIEMPCGLICAPSSSIFSKPGARPGY